MPLNFTLDHIGNGRWFAWQEGDGRGFTSKESALSWILERMEERERADSAA